MRKWHELSLDELETEINKPTSEEAGVKIHIFLSPFDIPEACRGYFDQKSERFTIEFRYLAEEDEKMVRPEGQTGITLYEGKNSGRVRRIEVDTEALNVSQVELKMSVFESVDNAIAFLESEGNDNRKAYYDVTRKIIKDNVEELSEELMLA